jgi:nucleotide-binding universal stress UspA family protein
MTLSCKRILVHVDATRAAPLRLALARRLAEQQGAVLAALYAATPVFMQIPYSPAGVPGVVSALAQIEAERLAAARKAFDETLQTPGPVATWAETSDVPVVGAFAEQAYCADLLVLGQRDPEDVASAAVPADFPAAVLIASGRPGVIVPCQGWKGPVARTVAVAWRPTRESARALLAALPLLQQAAKVHVLQWGDDAGANVRGAALDIAGYLHLHGVEATWHRGGPEPESLGDLLLSRCADLGADLLVMGCYGHARAREWVLGGASRTILESMTLPVLMAH